MIRARQIIAATHIEVEITIHFVVVDGRMRDGSHRTAGGAFDIGFVDHTVAEPALRQGECKGVVRILFNAHPSPQSYGPRIVAGGFSRRVAGYSRLGNVLANVGWQRKDREIPRYPLD